MRIASLYVIPAWLYYMRYPKYSSSVGPHMMGRFPKQRKASMQVPITRINEHAQNAIAIAMCMVMSSRIANATATCIIFHKDCPILRLVRRAQIF